MTGAGLEWQTPFVMTGSNSFTAHFFKRNNQCEKQNDMNKYFGQMRSLDSLARGMQKTHNLCKALSSLKVFHAILCAVNDTLKRSRTPLRHFSRTLRPLPLPRVSLLLTLNNYSTDAR